jgi:hypothetical protein
VIRTVADAEVVNVQATRVTLPSGSIELDPERWVELDFEPDEVPRIVFTDDSHTTRCFVPVGAWVGSVFVECDAQEDKKTRKPRLVLQINEAGWECPRSWHVLCRSDDPWSLSDEKILELVRKVFPKARDVVRSSHYDPGKLPCNWAQWRVLV